jgi:hypothetical protein
MAPPVEKGGRWEKKFWLVPPTYAEQPSIFRPVFLWHIRSLGQKRKKLAEPIGNLHSLQLRQTDTVFWT